MVCRRVLECFCRCVGHILYGGWHLQLRCWYHEFAQGDRLDVGVVLCRQLQHRIGWDNVLILLLQGNLHPLLDATSTLIYGAGHTYNSGGRLKKVLGHYSSGKENNGNRVFSWFNATLQLLPGSDHNVYPCNVVAACLPTSISSYIQNQKCPVVDN